MDETPLSEALKTLRIGLRKVAGNSRAPREKAKTSPYYGVEPLGWPDVTRHLIAAHPLDPGEIVAVVHRAWQAIFTSVFGDGFRIGLHIFPAPQVLGWLLHELVPLEFQASRQGEWRAYQTAADKDLVCMFDDRWSIEIKTSSHAKQIFANRSYGLETESEGKKAKSGYYLAINFHAWPSFDAKPAQQVDPGIRSIRFGWLDSTDWQAQKAESGQQSNLPPLIENTQLLMLWPSEE